MTLQDILLSKIISGLRIGEKITNSQDIAISGEYALDAVEKNPTIEGTLACQIQQLASGIPPTTGDGNPITTLVELEEDVANLNTEVETLKKSVSDGKILVANAITDKGVTTATDASFEALANNVSKLCSVIINGRLVSNYKLDITRIAHLTSLSTIIPSKESFASMPSGLYFQDGSVVEYDNGLILIGLRTTSGNATTSTLCYKYNPSTNTWSKYSTLPVAFISDCALVYENRIHIFQGTYHYRLNNGTWEIVSTLPVSLDNTGGYVKIFNGYIHLISGSSLYKFNGTSWSLVSTISVSGTTVAVSRSNSCVEVIDKEIHVIKGTSHYKYTTSGGWVKKSLTLPMTIANNGYPESVVIDNNIFVIVKDSAGTETYQKLYTYSYANDKWSTVGNLDNNYSGGSAIYDVKNSKLYVIGGNYNSSTDRTTIRFNITTEENEIIVNSIEPI